MDETLNNEDKNGNGIPDIFEYTSEADVEDFNPMGNPFDYAYSSEDAIKDYIPDYKDYKWYKNDDEGYFFSFGEKILKEAVEEGIIEPEQAEEIEAKMEEEAPNIESNTDESLDVPAVEHKMIGSFLPQEVVVPEVEQNGVGNNEVLSTIGTNANEGLNSAFDSLDFKEEK